MHQKQMNKTGKVAVITLFIAVVLTGFTNMDTVVSFTNLYGPGDTVKMVSGVPLKPEDISPLLSGESIPVVNLLNAAGQPFDLNAAVASKPTILIFYRGGWCPYCNKQLSGLQEIEQDLRKTGYQIIAISTDSPDNLKQTEIKNKLTYTLLSDADLSISKQF